ncbi:MAG: N-acetylglucosamine-6-phosphate deacetylase [Clostridium sp.]|jgi:N-acetylglucosamine-6-phosphate deacetylase|nr:N-acetylglucosamine-6-phosphate deacetylase [Clostridium sp.]
MLLKNATVICGAELEPRRMDLRVEDGLIAEMAPSLEGDGLELDGLWLLPGLVDIHVHGIAGADFCDGNSESPERMSLALARHGVTSFCPASMTLPEERLAAAFELWGRFRGRESGARILGVRMEGPFFCEKKKGAQDAAFLLKPSLALLERLNSLCPVSVVDCAPELEGALGFAREAAKKHTVSIGHTAADYETAREALENGFSHATHLFNAMEPISARSPGVPTAVFESKSATAELICDGAHVHPALLRQAHRLLGGGRFVAVSDAMQAADMPDGEYSLGGQVVYVSGGMARLADGTIAGGTGNMFLNMQVLLKSGISFSDAVSACSLNPARVVRADGEIGSIELGKRADLLLTDGELSAVHGVFVRGKKLDL